MEIKLRTLTPLWTGGIAGECDRVHETGIIGSLRWWYEAVVRGLGGWTCDQEHDKCELSGKKLERYKVARENGVEWWDALEQVGMCDACKVFGTTGWKRRFRLEVQHSERDSLAWNKDVTLRVQPPNRQRGWFLPPGWQEQELKLQLVGDEEILRQMTALLLFLEQWGSLGAKPQLGYGLFQLINRQEMQKKARKFSGKEDARGTNNTQLDLPDLRTFTFFQARFQPRQANWWHNVDGLRQARGATRAILPQLADRGAVPVSPALKNYWRFGQKWPSVGTEQWLFGTLRREQRIRSKIGVSWALQQPDNTWLIRGWVWLPRNPQSSHHYAAIVNTTRQMIEDKSHWLAALNLRGNVQDLQVTVYPEKAAWGVKDAQTICDFVNGEK